VNSKPIIRSITLFLDTGVYTDRSALATALAKLEELSAKIAGRGYEVFTKRVSLPLAPLAERARIASSVDSKHYLVSIGAVKASELNSSVAELVNSGYYTAVYGIEKNPPLVAREVSRFIHKLSAENPVNATRVAVAMHGNPLESPYFPDSTSSGVAGVGFSLLLPRSLAEFYRAHGSLEEYTNVMKSYVSELVACARESGFERVVVDYSISPWMDNSVVKLLEYMGFKLLEPGFLYGVHALNKLVNRFATVCGYAGGFNEVMLPYAEDDALRDAGLKGLVKARDFLYFSSVCVAGPDMLVVPESTEKLAGLILDTYSVWLVKKRAMSLRAIPVVSEPGETVDLGRFGRVAVINY